MNIYKLIPIIILGAFLFSCQKEIEIDANSLTPKIVVDGRIETGSLPQIILRNSGFLYDTIDLEATYIHDAIVEINDGTNTTTLIEKCFIIYNKLDSVLSENDSINQNQFLFQLIQVDEDQMDSMYYYHFRITKEEMKGNSQLICVYSYDIFSGGIPLLGEEGKTYTLTVKDGDRTVRATTTIPEKFAIDSLSYVVNEEAEEFSEVFIHFTFPENISLGHYIQYGSKTQYTNYFYGMRTGSVYADADFVGSTSLKVPIDNRRDKSRPISAERQFQSGDTVSVIWKNIDKETYLYTFTSENDGGSSPFSSPVKIISNVENGLGIWGGYNVSTSRIYIP